jgi:predicted metal-binding membrane protein
VTTTRIGVTTATLSLTLGLAAAAWVVTVRQMGGMDMGGGTSPGPFSSFVGFWAVMMAAMMLPAAVPAVLIRASANGRVSAALRFIAAYLIVWTLIGVLIFALYRPPGSTAAGLIVIAAGVYELTRFKRECRRRCRESAGSGWRFGLNCAGSSIGLMLMLVAIGLMSLTWMILVALLVLIQKFLPPKPAIDIPLALSLIAFGLVILGAPSSVPGLAPSMPSMPGM